LGEGSCFSAYFPLSQPAAEAELPGSEAAGVATGQLAAVTKLS
jgi:hypothetical protein